MRPPHFNRHSEPIKNWPPNSRYVRRQNRLEDIDAAENQEPPAVEIGKK